MAEEKSVRGIENVVLLVQIPSILPNQLLSKKNNRQEGEISSLKLLLLYYLFHFLSFLSASSQFFYHSTDAMPGLG